LSNFQPIPIKVLNGKIIFADGHTRAFVAYKHGLTQIPLYWENEELSWHLYESCVEECNIRGVFNIKDLEIRIVNSNDYKILWEKWCDNLQSKNKFKETA